MTAANDDSMTARSKRTDALQQLRTALEAGTWPRGTSLPPEHALTTRLGVGRNTVREAVSVLVQEGWLERVQGRGTLVRAVPSATRPRTCMVIARAGGDVYTRQMSRLIEALAERRVMALVLGAPPDHENGLNADYGSACVQHALSQGLDGIIMDSHMWWVLHLATQRAERCPPIAIIGECAHLPEHPVHRIVADFEGGAFAAVEHLRRLGHERILCVMHRNTRLKAGQTIETAEGRYGEIIRGYRAALGTKLEPRYLFLEHEFMAADEIQELQALLRSRHRPTAVFAVGDYRAKVVIDLARRQGLRVPEDLSVVGYYDTPWATHMEQPLTSVAIDMDSIVDLAVERLFPLPTSDAPIAGAMSASASSLTVIPSRLVVRDTCAAVPTRSQPTAVVGQSG